MKFILDTNVYIHFNLFADCDWKKLLGSDDLTLLVTPTILAEIDKLKNDQRGFVSRRARKLGSIFDEIGEGKSQSSGIIVDFLEKSTKNFDWNLHGLDESRKDDNIIAEILVAMNSSDDEICIITADSLFKRKAMAHQIRSISPPEGWRKDQRDPKDKRIQELEDLVKKTIPEVKLCLQNNGNCEESLEISIGTLGGVMLTEEYIADLEKENTRKLEAMRETSSMELSDLCGVFSKEAYGFEEALNEYSIDRYEEALNEYIISYKHVRDDLVSIMQIPLVLKNIGTMPAENIDVIVKLPEYIEPTILPEFPAEPKGPEEFMRLALAISYPNLSLSIDQNEQKIFKGPMIEKSNNRVRYWIKSLKHNFKIRLPLYARFKPYRKAQNFQVDYKISISNHPNIKNGRLIAKIKQE